MLKERPSPALRNHARRRDSLHLAAKNGLREINSDFHHRPRRNGPHHRDPPTHLPRPLRRDPRA